MSTEKVSSNIQKFDVSVKFRNDLSTFDIVKTVSSMQNPNVIIWYIGPYGAKEIGIDFYRKFLIEPIFLSSIKATFWLVDLTAWAALKNPHCSISNVSRIAKVIQQFNDPRIQILHASDILDTIQTVNCQDIIAYFEKVFLRKSIYKMSKGFPKNNLKLCNVLSSKSAILHSLLEHDTSIAYSPLQYLEGCFLVLEIFKKLGGDNKRRELIFALPNDEIEYYEPDKTSFMEDISFLLTNQIDHNILNGSRLNIQFLSFRYGDYLKSRPYNAVGNSIRNKNFSLNRVCGRMRTNS